MDFNSSAFSSVNFVFPLKDLTSFSSSMALSALNAGLFSSLAVFVLVKTSFGVDVFLYKSLCCTCFNGVNALVGNKFDMFMLLECVIYTIIIGTVFQNFNGNVKN